MIYGHNIFLKQKINFNIEMKSNIYSIYVPITKSRKGVSINNRSLLKITIVYNLYHIYAIYILYYYIKHGILKILWGSRRLVTKSLNILDQIDENR